MDAINDAFLLESSIYRLLRLYCRGDPEGEERHRREAAPPGWEGQVIEAGDSLPRLVRGAEGRVDLPLHGHEPDKCVQRT